MVTIVLKVNISQFCRLFWIFWQAENEEWLDTLIIDTLSTIKYVTLSVYIVQSEDVPSKVSSKAILDFFSWSFSDYVIIIPLLYVGIAKVRLVILKQRNFL